MDADEYSCGTCKHGNVGDCALCENEFEAGRSKKLGIDCKPHCDVSKAVRVSRATFVCVKCRADMSMQYLLWYEAKHDKSKA